MNELAQAQRSALAHRTRKPVSNSEVKNATDAHARGRDVLSEVQNLSEGRRKDELGEVCVELVERGRTKLEAFAHADARIDECVADVETRVNERSAVQALIAAGTLDADEAIELCQRRDVAQLALNHSMRALDQAKRDAHLPASEDVGFPTRESKRARDETESLARQVGQYGFETTANPETTGRGRGGITSDHAWRQGQDTPLEVAVWWILFEHRALAECAKADRKALRAAFDFRLEAYSRRPRP